MSRQDLAYRHRADDRGDRLRTHITAGSDQDRDEDGEHRYLLEDRLISLLDCDGHELGEEEDEQPRDALAEQHPRRRASVGDVQWLGAAEALHVFGCLFLDDLVDVVVRDDADEAALKVDDRDREQATFGHDPRGELLVIVYPDAPGIWRDEVDHLRLRRAEHQAVQ